MKSLCRLRRLPADHPAIQEEIAEIYANHQCASNPVSSKRRLLTIASRNVPWTVELSRLLSRWYAEKNNHRLFATSFATADWCELHVRLWYSMTCTSRLTILRSFYYGTQYFTNAGFKNAFIITVITNSVNVASTFPGLYLVEKMGRRNLLLMGAVG